MAMEKQTSRFRSNACTPIAQGALVGGVFGSAWGGILGTLRNQPVGFYSTAMGFNFFIASGIYCSAYQCIKSMRGGTDSPWNAVIAGVSSGSLLSGLFAGPRKVPIGAFMFTVGGLGIFYTQQIYYDWKENARRIMINEINNEYRKKSQKAVPKEFKEQIQESSQESWIPNWSPIQKVDHIEYRNKLKKRLLEIDAELEGKLYRGSNDDGDTDNSLY